MKRFVFWAAVFVFMFAGIVFGDGKYNGGSGVEGDPYQIATAAHLHALGQDPNDWDKHFLLTSDLDLTGVEMSPIGLGLNPFIGVFNGGRHVISNLTINLPNSGYVGLFGCLRGEVKNLGLENVSVTGKGKVGGLVGECSGGIISQCFSSGAVNGEREVGGLIGFAYSGIARNCYSSVAVTGDRIVGGFAGAIYNPNLPTAIKTICCYSVGPVIGNEYVEGFSYVAINKFNPDIFNFWDVDTSSITNSQYEYNGVVGLNTAFMKSSKLYSHCGWPGDVWTIDEGNDYPRLAWENMPGVPIPESTGFNGDGTAGDPYKIETAADLRILSFESSLWKPGKHFVLTTDLDMTNFFISPIGLQYFNKYVVGDAHMFGGSFDGGGHVISNLKIENSLEFDTGYTGFFSYIRQGAEVRNLGLENVDITGYEHVGGFAGFNSGTISQCFVTGVVDGFRYIGGFVGHNVNGIISDSYSNCSVSGTSQIGGFVDLGGYEELEGRVERCYCVGTVTGEDLTAGFVVAHFDKYKNCFWDSTVNPGMTDCFLYDCDDIEGMSTEDMMIAENFTGWDFVGNDIDGHLDVWRLCVDGSGYPRLAWEYARVGDFVCGDGVDMDDFAYFSARDYCDGCGGVFGAGGGIVDVEILAKLAGQWLSVECGDCGGADVSGDGRVGLADFGKVAGQWLCSAPVNWDRCDMDGDGVVGDSDFDIWVSYWLEE